jgi:hypothetical protein
MRHRVGGCLLMILLSSRAVYGHHSRSAFDMQARPATLEGTVTKVEWANPHVYLYIKTLGNSAERWVLEGDNVAQTEQQCWKRDSIQPGDEVVLSANPPRDPDKRLGHLTMLEKDGRTLWDYRSPCIGDSISGKSKSIDGVWKLETRHPGSERSGVLAPYDGRYDRTRSPSLRSLLPLTPAGREALETYSDETTAALACTPVSSPLSLISGGPIAIDVP